MTKTTIVAVVREKHEQSFRSWRVSEGDRHYWVTCRWLSGGYGPSWSVSVFIEPKGDQKPYWRPLRSWQRLAGEVRAFEVRTARDRTQLAVCK